MAVTGEAVRREQIDTVRRRIEANGNGTPPGFAEALFAFAPPEDLEPLSPEALAALAREAWTHLSERRPGRHHVRVYNPDLSAAGGREITVVEAVNDDMPFLVDSAMGELAERGIEARLVVHPILAVERDAGGLARFAGDANRLEAEDTPRESLIHIHVDRIDDEAARDALAEGLDRTLADVRQATQDWAAMTRRVKGVIRTYKVEPPPLPRDEVIEAVAFLEWLVDNNFTFLGLRDYAFIEDEDGGRLEPVLETGLGLLRDRELRLLRRGAELVTFTPEIRAFLREPVPLIVTKASVRSRVHRRAHLDYVGVKLFDAQGHMTGELRLVGLFTATAYTRSTRAIPLLRRKVDYVLARAGFDPDSHSGKALVNVLESYPRDELFQVDADTIFDFALQILSLYERPRVRVLTRADEFDRFVSVLVFVPRDKYDSGVRARVGAYLAKALQGRLSAYYPAFLEGVPLTRVHYIVGRDAGPAPAVDRPRLEADIAGLVQTWSDRLRAALAGAVSGERARALAGRYAGAFGAGYQEVFEPGAATADIQRFEKLSAERPLAIEFYRRDADPDSRVSLKIYSRSRPIPLSERVPMLDDMGFRAVNERTYRIDPAGDPKPARIWLHDMTLEKSSGGEIELRALEARLEALFMAVATGRAESDGYNALALEAGLGWRDVATIRAMSRYLRQALIPFSQDYMWSVLNKHAAIAGAIAELFHARFDPRAHGGEGARDAAQAEIAARIEQALGGVASLDEDRILRRFTNLVQAMVRSNFYQLAPNGQPKEVISFKLESRGVEALPAPRPLYEIFVYAPRMEGVHLRFGKVARGGLRWSDRAQDFRTEVLGLVKAQQVKNAVIVPVGAKGGFFPKRLPSGPREAWLAEGAEAYKIFIGSLLDLTDNLDGPTVMAPPDTVRHDGDDPYLVVAADKGTATYSDTANAIATQRGFWLDDAFASGGSAGYDHKKMGITARGAWEAVKRHFREMDADIQTTPFTVAGVGDMSGDVFGNGMLLSRAIRLVAAFDHRDIFIDPEPDPESSFAERERLFALPRSSWRDYDKPLISPGGGVFSRAAKAIPLSPESQALLGLPREHATPAEVMSAILRLPVDLMWFGGIGTYVRASTETDEAVGDRANDAIRVTGKDLRCKVIGEGANLGATQLGRIEAALGGVRLNTDAIDNSAGVNSSDVEVNFKIALSTPMREGTLTRESRNGFLASMTGDVAGLVLRNNYQQTLALSLAERRGLEDLGFERRLMQTLESRGLLDRAVEFLPDEPALEDRARAREALTRPELAVLLAYAKITLYDDLLQSQVPDDRYLGRELFRYFPQPMQERFPEAIGAHRLRREIIATGLSNSMINRGGPSFVVRLTDQTGADVASLAAAFAAVRDSYRLTEINAAIDALDARIPGALQLELYAAVQDLMLSRIVWFVRNVDLTSGLESIVERFQEGIDAVAASLDGALPADAREDRTMRTEALVRKGVPQELALWLASLPALHGAPDAVLVGESAGQSIGQAAETLFAAAAFLGLDDLRPKARMVPIIDYYERLALDRAIDTIGAAERGMAVAAARHGCGREGVAAWAATRPDAARVRKAVQEISGSGLTLAKLTVAASLLADLAQA